MGVARSLLPCAAGVASNLSIASGNQPVARATWRRVITEFARKRVLASYIFDYRYGTAPHDFLHDDPLTRPDWIVTNRSSISPASSRSAPSTSPEKVSPCWCERNGSKALAATKSFSETARLRSMRHLSNACPWSKVIGTQTLYGHSYAWFIWRKFARGATALFWIPPGCRAALTLPDDRRRFAAWTLAPTATPLFDERNEERSVSTAGEAQANSA